VREGVGVDVGGGVVVVGVVGGVVVGGVVGGVGFCRNEVGWHH